MGEVKVALTLLDDLSSKDKRACLELLIKIFGNVIKHPDDPKYRTLKTSNKTFQAGVWRHVGGRAVMEAAGWQVRDDAVHLPPHINLDTPLQLLLANREVKPDEAAWVEETKIVVANSSQAKEEELRRKALEDKEKQMAALKKEMAERKAIAERIRAEHRHDQEMRRSQHAQARPLTGQGGFKRMSDMLAKDGSG